MPTLAAAGTTPYNDRMASLPTGTVTYLMTDVVGSARLWEANPEDMADALKVHDKLAAKAAKCHLGHLVKARGEGDSHFLVFEDASNAISAAIDFICDLERQKWPDGVEIRIRCGIHTGSAEFREQDYYGPAVNRCARLRGIANAGQILISDAAHQLMQDDLPEGVTLTSLGTHRLKDLLRPENVWEVAHPELPPSVEAPVSLNRIQHNLPVQLTSFVGREEEVRKVIDLLGVSRLVTLTGSGGSGKTRLALQVGAEAADDYKDGVWFIDLTRLSPEEECAHLAAKTLHLGERVGQSWIDVVQHGLRERRTLLILDNCEHVIDDAAEFAASVMVHCPNTVILATSREVLRVPGEVRCRVPALALPGRGADLKSVTASDSVQLFIERAKLRDPHFQLTEKNFQAVADLCRLLDGIPLAIEQAATHAALLTPLQMIRRFKDHLRDLRTTDRGVPARHRTIKATIDWSYESLSEPQQLLLQYCAIFSSGWTLDAIENVGANLGLERDEIPLDLLALLNKSLVFEEEGSSEERRFRMLQTIREYALDQLGERKGAAREAHAEHFRKVIGNAASTDLLALASAQHDDLLMAAEFYLTKGGNKALEMVSGIRSHLLRGGHVKKGKELLSAAIGHYTGEDAPKALALNALGAFHWRLRDYAAARKAYGESLLIWETLNNRQQQAAVLHNLGLVAVAEKDFADATDLIERSHAAYQVLGDESGMAVTLMNLGRVQLDRGALDESTASLTKATFLLAKVDDQTRLAICRCNLALSLLLSDDPLVALRELTYSFRIWLLREDKGALAIGLAVLACIASDLEAKAEATAMAKLSHMIEDEIGYPVDDLERGLLGKHGLDRGALEFEPVATQNDHEMIVQQALLLCVRLTGRVKAM